MDLTIVPGCAALRPQRTLGDCMTPAGQRFADTTVDMGTGFGCFDPKTATQTPRVSTG